MLDSFARRNAEEPGGVAVRRRKKSDVSERGVALFERAVELGGGGPNDAQLEEVARSLLREAQESRDWESTLQFAMGTATARLPEPRAFQAFRVLDAAGKLATKE